MELQNNRFQNNVFPLGGGGGGGGLGGDATQHFTICSKLWEFYMYNQSTSRSTSI